MNTSSEEYEFLVTAIYSFADSSYVEGLDPTNKVISLIDGSNEIKIQQDEGKAKVKATYRNRTVEGGFPIDTLISHLNKAGLIDQKLNMKLDFVFSSNSSVVRAPQIVIVSLRAVIGNQYPDLKDSIDFHISKDQQTIELHLKNGLEDPEFKRLLNSFIFSKVFFNNCKTFGVTKVVFIDIVNQVFDDIHISHYDMSKLK